MGINPNDKCQMPRWVPTLSPLPLQFHQEDTEFFQFKQPTGRGPEIWAQGRTLGLFQMNWKSAEPETTTHGDT